MHEKQVMVKVPQSINISVFQFCSKFLMWFKPSGCFDQIPQEDRGFFGMGGSPTPQLILNKSGALVLEVVLPISWNRSSV